MAFDPREWSDVMGDMATIFPASTRDAYGTVSTVVTGVAYKGHVTYEPRRITTNDGEEVVSTTQFIVAGMATVGFEDRVTLSNGRSYRVLGIRTFHDEDGPHHVTLMLT